MRRLMEKMVLCGLVTPWRLATWPTRRSPDLAMATTEGVVRPPSALGMTTGSPPSITALAEFVVPRSIPIALGMGRYLFFRLATDWHRWFTDCLTNSLGMGRHSFWGAIAEGQALACRLSGSPPSMTAMAELAGPRPIPMA